MWGWILDGVKWLLGLWLKAPAAPSQEAAQAAKAAAATVTAQGAENAVVELKEAAAADAAANVVQLRVAGTGPVTINPGAPINQIDAADRRD